MEVVDIINNILKIFFLTLCIYFVYIKITNYKENSRIKVTLVILSSIFISIIYTILIANVSSINIYPILYILYGIILAYITKNKLNYSIIITVISYAISYVVYLISIIISGTIVKLLFPNTEVNNPIIILLVMIIETIILFRFFKIKRFKNGFYFLQNTNFIENIGTFTILLGGLVLLINGLMHDFGSYLFNTYLYAGLAIIIISIIIWIHTQITKQYRENMKDRTIKMQEDEIKEHLATIKRLSKQVSDYSSIIHKYNDRFSALEMSVQNAILNTKTEYSSEFLGELKEVKEMSKKFTSEVESSRNKIKTLQKTNILGIDNILSYMQSECIKNNIEFNIKVNDSINYLIESIIPKDKLETLLSDHIKDAIIAINSGSNEYRSILVIIGIIDNCYEISIYDSGIEFEINTLVNLGLERITTHADNGGSGIGFMTTFETLKQCKASLIIEEKEITDLDYTKAVIIRFDDKNEYKIKSYRAENIIEKDIEKRIIVANM